MRGLGAGKHLPIGVVELIDHVSSPLRDVAPAMRAQAEAAVIVSASATMIDVEIPPGLPSYSCQMVLCPELPWSVPVGS